MKLRRVKICFTELKRYDAIKRLRGAEGSERELIRFSPKRFRTHSKGKSEVVEFVSVLT